MTNERLNVELDHLFFFSLMYTLCKLLDIKIYYVRNRNMTRYTIIMRFHKLSHALVFCMYIYKLSKTEPVWYHNTHVHNNYCS